MTGESAKGRLCIRLWYLFCVLFIQLGRSGLVMSFTAMHCHNFLYFGADPVDHRVRNEFVSPTRPGIINI